MAYANGVKITLRGKESLWELGPFYDIKYHAITLHVTRVVIVALFCVLSLQKKKKKNPRPVVSVKKTLFFTEIVPYAFTHKHCPIPSNRPFSYSRYDIRRIN